MMQVGHPFPVTSLEKIDKKFIEIEAKSIYYYLYGKLTFCYYNNKKKT
jgi:hypothetical protein